MVHTDRKVRRAIPPLGRRVLAFDALGAALTADHEDEPDERPDDAVLPVSPVSRTLF